MTRLCLFLFNVSTSQIQKTQSDLISQSMLKDPPKYAFLSGMDLELKTSACGGLLDMGKPANFVTT